MLRDFVEETTDTSGLGDLTLNGAEPGRRTFAAAFGTGSGNPCLYVTDDGAGNWEVAESYLSATTTIVRGGAQNVRASSNGGNPVDFPAGTKRIFCDVAAGYLQDLAKASRQITAGTGLTGGGDLTADRTLALTGQALALHNLGTNGLVARTGSGTFAARQINAGTGVQVSSNDGVAGNPTVALTGQALDLHNVGTNGFFVKTGPSSVAPRVLQAGSGISITNAGGANGDPIISATSTTSGFELIGTANLASGNIKKVEWASGAYKAVLMIINGLRLSEQSDLSLSYTDDGISYNTDNGSFPDHDHNGGLVANVWIGAEGYSSMVFEGAYYSNNNEVRQTGFSAVWAFGGCQGVGLSCGFASFSAGSLTVLGVPA